MGDYDIIQTVAEKIMGWKVIPGRQEWQDSSGNTRRFPQNDGWDPLEDEEANAEILDQCAKEGWLIRLSSSGMFPIEWYCSLTDFGIDVTDTDRKRAVVMAVWKAVQ